MTLPAKLSLHGVLLRKDDEAIRPYHGIHGLLRFARNDIDRKREQGFSLIELTLGIAFLGLIAAALFAGLSGAFQANSTAKKQSTALSLAQSQLEDIENQPYKPAPSGEATYATIGGIPNGYSIWSVNRAGATVQSVISVIGVPWDSASGTAAATWDNKSLQKIKLVIRQGNKDVLTLETYKIKPK